MRGRIRVDGGQCTKTVDKLGAPSVRPAASVGAGDGYRLVAVEGVIGVGKTTLVERLARVLRGRTVLEEFEDNPFLARFYQDRRAYALSTQLFFLMSRFRQQERLTQGDLFHHHTVADYIFDKDRIFADLTLEGHELGVYDRLFDVLRPQVATPDLVIFLYADHDVVMSRIERRGRSYEAGMDPDYIRDLAAAYDTFFARFDLCPVLSIDTTELDLREDTATLSAVAEIVHSGADAGRLDIQRKRAQRTLV